MKLTWKCPSSNISPLKKFSFKFLVSHINKLQKGWVESGGMAKKVTFNHVKKMLKINGVLIVLGFYQRRSAYSVIFDFQYLL